jgi:hypothetical protein
MDGSGLGRVLLDAVQRTDADHSDADAAHHSRLFVQALQVSDGPRRRTGGPPRFAAMVMAAVVAVAVAAGLAAWPSLTASVRAAQAQATQPSR